MVLYSAYLVLEQVARCRWDGTQTTTSRMKAFLKKLYCLLALFLVTASVFGQSAGEQDSLKKVFRQATNRWRQAYNSGDAKQLAPLYTEDVVYLSSHVEGLVAEGRDRVVANFQKGITGGGHIDTVEIISMSVSCNLALLHCQYQATNSGVTVTGRNLLVLRRVGDQWLIATHMTVVN